MSLLKLCYITYVLLVW